MSIPSEPSSLAAIKAPISEEDLDQLFRKARTHSTWTSEPVPVELLRKAYELARLGPTSANGSPARFVFLTTPGAKALLKPVLAPGNVDKTMAAPVTVIIAWDTEFHEHFPRLFPYADMRSYFAANKPLMGRLPSATVHFKPHISFWPLVLWGWIADRCPVSTQTN